MNNLVNKVLADSVTNVTPGDSVTNGVITERDTLEGHYCSYRAYQGMVWAALEEAEVCTDFLNERLYFRALEKIGVVVRGKTTYNEGNVTVSKTKTGSHYPPQSHIQGVYNNGSNGIYAIKRGTYGFNCADQADLARKVLSPIVDIFTKLVEEIETRMTQIEDSEESLKAMGVAVSDAKALTSKSIINKYL